MQHDGFYNDHFLTEVLCWIEDLKGLRNDPSVVWPDVPQPATVADSLPNDLKSRVKLAELRQKLEVGVKLAELRRLSNGRLCLMREALHLANTIRIHRGSAVPMKQPERAALPPVFVDSAGVPAKCDDPPPILMAATGKGNRQANPLEVVGETVPIEWADEPAGVYVQNDDGKVIEDAVYRGTLRANFVMSGEGPTEQERNILLRKTLGIGAAKIVDRNGTSETDRESEVERVKKQLQRSR